MKVILPAVEKIDEILADTTCSQDERSCGHFVIDDGTCTVDLNDGCDCDTYSGSGYYEQEA